jgi:hypothetical protein
MADILSKPSPPYLTPTVSHGGWTLTESSHLCLSGSNVTRTLGRRGRYKCETAATTSADLSC